MQGDWAQNEFGATEPVSTKLSQESFDRFARYITGELGIKMPESKMTMVQSRLLRRARELQLGSLDEYGEYFFGNTSSEEREYFINAITTNKTDFFREPEHFDYLVRAALPSLRAGADPGRPRLNVWSAGCSSGQEPYTLAMLLKRIRIAKSVSELCDPGHGRFNQSAGSRPKSDVRGVADRRRFQRPCARSICSAAKTARPVW